MSRITYYDLELEDLGKVYWSPNTCKTRFALNLKVKVTWFLLHHLNPFRY
jgi:hypothetical protein